MKVLYMIYINLQLGMMLIRLVAFLEEIKGISLALCTDGVNPFAHNKVTYSMWPIMLTLLNLPRNMRNLFANILLVGIIPSNGPKDPQSLTPYLDVLVEEMLEICSCTLFDAYQNAPFKCKAARLLYVLIILVLGRLCLWWGLEEVKGVYVL